jgi:hypothetical protein
MVDSETCADRKFTVLEGQTVKISTNSGSFRSFRSFRSFGALLRRWAAAVTGIRDARINCRRG